MNYQDMTPVQRDRLNKQRWLWMLLAGNMGGADHASYKEILDYADSNGIVAPPRQVQQLQNTLVRTLTDAGIWDKLDLFYLFANGAESEDFATINMANPGTFDATKIGRFKYDETGFMPLDDFSKIDTGLVIDDNWHLHDHAMMAMVADRMEEATGVTTGHLAYGGVNSTRQGIGDYMFSFGVPGQFLFYFYLASRMNSIDLSADPSLWNNRLVLANQEGDGRTYGFANGELIRSDTILPYEPTDEAMPYLLFTTTYLDSGVERHTLLGSPLRLWALGSALSSEEIVIFNGAVNAYLQALEDMHPIHDRYPGATPEYIAILNHADSIGAKYPIKTVQQFQDEFLTMLRNDGILQQMEVLYLFADGGAQEFALINMANPGTNDATLNGTSNNLPQGIQANSTDDIIGTGFENGTIADWNVDAMFGGAFSNLTGAILDPVYIRLIGGFSVNQGRHFFYKDDITSLGFRSGNQTGEAPFSLVGNDSKILIARYDNGVGKIYIDGSQAIQFGASIPSADAEITFNGYLVSGEGKAAPNLISQMAFIAGTLSDAQIATLSSGWAMYLQKMEAALHLSQRIANPHPLLQDAMNYAVEQGWQLPHQDVQEQQNALLNALDASGALAAMDCLYLMYNGGYRNFARINLANPGKHTLKEIGNLYFDNDGFWGGGGYLEAEDYTIGKHSTHYRDGHIAIVAQKYETTAAGVEMVGAFVRDQQSVFLRLTNNRDAIQGSVYNYEQSNTISTVGGNADKQLVLLTNYDHEMITYLDGTEMYRRTFVRESGNADLPLMVFTRQDVTDETFVQLPIQQLLMQVVSVGHHLDDAQVASYTSAINAYVGHAFSCGHDQINAPHPRFKEIMDAAEAQGFCLPTLFTQYYLNNLISELDGVGILPKMEAFYIFDDGTEGNDLYRMNYGYDLEDTGNFVSEMLYRLGMTKHQNYVEFHDTRTGVWSPGATNSSGTALHNDMSVTVVLDGLDELPDGWSGPIFGQFRGSDGEGQYMIYDKDRNVADFRLNISEANATADFEIPNAALALNNRLYTFQRQANQAQVYIGNGLVKDLPYPDFHQIAYTNATFTLGVCADHTDNGSWTPPADGIYPNALRFRFLAIGRTLSQSEISLLRSALNNFWMRIGGQQV